MAGVVIALSRDLLLTVCDKRSPKSARKKKRIADTSVKVMIILTVNQTLGQRGRCAHNQS